MTDKTSLKSFGLTVGVAFLILAGVFLLKGNTLAQGVSLVIGVILIVCGQTFPMVLKPIYRIWMAAAEMMSWVSTRVILLALFIFLFLPVSLTLKILGKDELGLKLKGDKSYWIKKPQRELSREDYLKQY